jgi:N-acetylornithine carbamoyltransferase
MSTLRHCYCLTDFSLDELHSLLELAEQWRSVKHSNRFQGKAVLSMFLASSLRTRVSMDLAARQIGAHSITLAAENLWKLEFGEGVRMDGESAEHVHEAVGALSRYADILAVRAFPSRKSWEADREDPVLRAFQRHSPVPVVNLESTLFHPCQALADLLTIQRASQHRPPRKIVLSWAPHPRCLPVAVPNSFVLGVVHKGWPLTIARPEGYDLPADVLEKAAALAAERGTTLTITDDREAAFDGADYVYAKSWGRIDCYGEEDRELSERAAAGLDTWQVDAEIMSRTADAAFMHCLPVRRNVVVSDAVIDSPRSLVFEQAENRLHVQKALLVWLLSQAEGKH